MCLLITDLSANGSAVFEIGYCCFSMQQDAMHSQNYYHKFMFKNVVYEYYADDIDIELSSMLMEPNLSGMWIICHWTFR